MLPSTSAVREYRKQVDDNIAIYILQFYSLADAILEEAASPAALINDTTIRNIISSVLADMDQAGQLTSFAPMIEKPGFISVLVDWLREMKSQGIHPETYQAYVDLNTTNSDSQLAAFYTRYQRTLQAKGFADPDGRLWLAAEAMEKEPELFVHKSPLYVLGHDQFTPVELRILQSLANRFESMTIYLPWSAARDEDDLALTRLRDTLEALRNHLDLEVQTSPQNPRADPALTHLRN